MGGLTFEKILLIGIIAAFIFGPERLPTLAAQFAQLIKRVRGWTEDAKTRVSDELGEDFSQEDWRKLDPRQYDPRRIIRDAWNDADPNVAAKVAPAAAVAAGAAVASSTVPAGSSAPAWATGKPAGADLEPGRAPFDNEAT